MVNKYRLTQFCVAVSESETFGPFVGYTDGSVSYNHRPAPAFTRAKADGIIAAWNYAHKETSANYDPDLDAYVFHGDEDDCVVFDGFDMLSPTGTHYVRVYAIGMGEWQWEEYID